MNLTTRIQNWMDGFLPLLAQRDADSLRHCRLIIAFGFLGNVFGMIYAVFYCLIGHYYGAAIVAYCDAFFLAVPWMLRGTKRHFSFHGQLLCVILTLGFTSLAAIEGGVRGHAITWLATIPFCAVLLIGINASYVWCGICMAITIIFSAIDFRGIRMPYLYPGEWHASVTMAGYLGLAFFLFLLAHIFERGRLEAQQKMLQAYDELANATNQLVHANEDLEQANRQLVQLNREKNEFIAIAAHDLKNPLATVLGYAEILAIQQQPNREGNKLFGEKIKNSADRMLQLVTDLLDINAIEEGRMGLKMEDVEAGSIVRQVMTGLQQAAVRKNIAIHFALPQSVYVAADARALMQVIENFLSNAIKYSPPGRNVHINVAPVKAQGQVTIEIQDEGTGLSEEDQFRLFQKYSRLTPQPTGGESSNGLGLSIVKRLAESMGGTVGCRSKVGHGTIFWVTLRGYSAVVAA